VKAGSGTGNGVHAAAKTAALGRRRLSLTIALIPE
jgi:hypothetical protein